LEVVAARFRAAFARQEAVDRAVHGLRTNRAREHDRWQAIVAEVFPELDDTAALYERLWRHFADPGNWSVFADVELALEALDRSGLHLAIATNFDERLLGVVRSVPELARFSEPSLFISAAVGWRKPAAQFFLAVERGLGLAAGEILLVGDDPESDLAGARSACWQAAWLRREGRLDHPAQIASLAELRPGAR
jgi:putative hydrolase of the HAD superfamily